MNSPVEPPESSSFRLEQVDPPHPFLSSWKIWLTAAVILTAGWAIFWFSVQHPPPAAGEVTSVYLYPIQSGVNQDAGGAGMAGSSESYNQLLILARITVRNQGKIPIFLNDVQASLTLPGGAPQHNIAAGRDDFARVFEAFPSLSSHYEKPFRRDATLQPGEQTEGLAIFSFPVTRQQWDARKDARILVSFIHQPDLALKFPE